MLSEDRFLKGLMLLALCAVTLGCPRMGAPDQQVALMVSPNKLDFGVNQTALTFEIRKTWSARPMAPLQLMANQPWITATADRTVSTGPDDPVTVTVTVNRLLMNAGDNQGTVAVISEGVIQENVAVGAKAPLVADFRTTTTFAFVGDPVVFLDESRVAPGEGSILGWLWDFGDGHTSTARNPVHVYAAPGVYTVSLTVGSASASGVMEEKRNYITIAAKQPPSARFAASATRVLLNEPIRFTDLSEAGTAPITSWFWTFGDGASSTDRNPLHAYTTPGSYDVSLVVVTAHGSDTQVEPGYVTVRAVNPSADFTVSNRTPLMNVPIQFTDRSSPGTSAITSWYWEFGDGVTSTIQHPIHAYTDPGRYTVRLTVQTATASSTEEKVGYILARSIPPIADFSVVNPPLVEGEPVQFQDQSQAGTAPITSWRWNFGDGTPVSTEQHPAHVFGTPGPYTITLTVTTAHGTNSTQRQFTVIAKQPPSAAFSASPQSSFVGDPVHFQDQSAPGTAPITQWEWDFNGDGVTDSSLQNPTFVYTTPGTYTVGLRVTSAHGTDTEVRTGYVTVRVKIGPKAQFAVANRTGYVGDDVIFQNLTTELGTAPTPTWLWNFGDGSAPSAAQNPTHVYTTAGTYTVSLRVTTPHGSDTETKPDYVNIRVTANPTADFGVSTRNPIQGQPVRCIDLSMAGTAPITNWIWDFGDGTPQVAVQNPVHTYANLGLYTVRLTVQSRHGSDTEVLTNYIAVRAPGSPVPPTADFMVSTRNPFVGAEVQFWDLSDPGDAAITSWLWNFGDGATSNLQYPRHAYAATGAYTIRLTVQSIYGIETKVEPWYVTPREPGSPQPPIADFEVSDRNPVVAQSVDFTDLSSPGDAPITSWLWEFGDGETSTGQNPTHAYAAVGSYTVRLTVISEVSAETKVKPKHIVVRQPGGPEPPIAAFEADPPLTRVINDAIQFRDLSDPGSAPITSWIWHFGDGTPPSTLRNPTHAYTAPGVYTVRLTVETSVGADTAIELDYLIIVSNSLPPAADFDVMDPDYRNPYVNQEIQFQDLSDPGTSPITAWRWNFGDGSTFGTEQNSRHIYRAAAMYTVTLTVTTVVGADAETKIDFIHVWEPGTTTPPTADFEALSQTVYAGEAVHFVDMSSPGSAPITAWYWEFDDGTSPGTVQSANHTYVIAGTYTVRLTVSSAHGADTHERVDYITVLPPVPPTANFTADDERPESGEEVQFTDTSDPGSSPITSWLWTFGDGATSTAQNPRHAYGFPGRYTVSLRVETAVGADVVVKIEFIIVYATMPPTADFVADITNPLQGRFVQFTDLSTPGDAPITSWFWEFGDGSTPSIQQNPRHQYTVAGPHTVSLTVTTAVGSHTATKTNYIVVRTTALGPTAQFSGDPVDPVVGEEVQFTDESDPGDGTITDWLWDFGDGLPNSTSSEQDPRHIYEAIATYTVTLRVDTVYGWDYEHGDITVQEPGPGAPRADFDVTNRNPIVGATVQFFDQSDPGAEPPILSWRWNFGDSLAGGGSVSTLQYPTHVYTAAALYTVSLTVRTTAGADSEIKVNYIGVSDATGAPTANFTSVNMTKGITGDFTRDLTGDTIAFMDGSAGKAITSLLWNFSDGATSALADPEHVFTSAGTHSVGLIATNVQGKKGIHVMDVSIFGATALDNYMRLPSTASRLHLQTVNGSGYTGSIYVLTSQVWQPGEYEDYSGSTTGAWRHYLTIFIPTSVTGNTAILFISGGDNGDSPPSPSGEEWALAADLAMYTGSPSALLTQVPNQSLTFTDDPTHTARWEDSIIAYSYDQFLNRYPAADADNWPVLIAMAKGAVRAMDTIQEIDGDVDDFFVMGASKRGWTTWLTAAVDTRVKAIAPMVIDVLNMVPQMDHHYSAYGEYSEAIQDYVDFNIFPRMGTTQGEGLRTIIDPFEYRTRLTMPKFGVNSTGDQFFLPDSAQFYFGQMRGDKYLRYVPNSDHSMAGHEQDVALSIGAFYLAAGKGALALPHFSWTVPSPGRMEVTPVDTPSAVRLWQATTNVDHPRDFRQYNLGNVWTSSTLTDPDGDGVYVAQVAPPSGKVAPPSGNRWTGFFVELQFPGPSPAIPFTFTTEVRVVPETMPFSPP